MPGTITVVAVEDDDDHADLLAFALAEVKDSAEGLLSAADARIYADSARHR
jgi:hypothetical protein